MADKDDARREAEEHTLRRPVRSPFVWSPNEDEEKALARLIDIEPKLTRAAKLSPETLAFLIELRPEEVETIRVLGRMDEDERKLLFDGIQLTKSVRTTARFAKWLLFGLLGIFLFFNQLSDQIGRFLATMQGGPR